MKLSIEISQGPVDNMYPPHDQAWLPWKVDDYRGQDWLLPAVRKQCRMAGYLALSLPAGQKLWVSQSSQYICEVYCTIPYNRELLLCLCGANVTCVSETDIRNQKSVNLWWLPCTSSCPCWKNASSSCSLTTPVTLSWYRNRSSKSSMPFSRYYHYT